MQGTQRFYVGEQAGARSGCLKNGGEGGLESPYELFLLNIMHSYK